MLMEEENKNYKVSVVIPVYNKEEYLLECITSITEQTLEDIEIICIDDGSQDSSASIIQGLQKDDKRIKLIQQPNSGASAARNTGVSSAQGDFIAFMDADDWYPDENVLKDLYNAANKYNVDICGGSLAESFNGVLRSSQYTDERKKYVFLEDGKIDYKDYQFDYGYTRFLYRKSLLKDNHLAFPSYGRFEDPPFFVKAMSCANSFYALSRCSYIYRVGYKTVSWNAKSLEGLALGLSDVISIAIKEQFWDLFNLEVSRINYNYLPLFYQAMDWKEFNESFFAAIKTLATVVASACSEKKEVNKIHAALMALLTGMELKKLPKEKASTFTNTSHPQVSVIIPVYNGEKYLEACLESVLCQTLSNIQIIVVDDGSTDSSSTIAERIAGTDSRIEIITKENGGLSSARNAGMKYVKGEYIQFLDCDDMLTPGALEILFRHSKENHLEQLFFSATSFYDTYKAFEMNPSYVSYYNYDGANYGNIYSGQELFSILKRNKEFKPSACLQFLTKSFLDKNGLTFYEGILHEDNLFTLECLSCSSRSAVITDHLYLRRVSEGSIMTSERNVKNAYGYFVTVCAFTKYLSTNTIKLSSEFEQNILEQNNLYLSPATNWYSETPENVVTLFVAGLTQAERVAFCSVMGFTEKLRESGEKKNEKIANLNARLSKSQKEVKRLKSSRSWRIGRVITWPLRKLKRIINNQQK